MNEEIQPAAAPRPTPESRFNGAFMFLCGARDFRKCPRSLALGQQPAAALYSKGLFQSTEFGRSPPFMVFLLCPIRTQTNTNLMQ